MKCYPIPKKEILFKTNKAITALTLHLTQKLTSKTAHTITQSIK